MKKQYIKPISKVIEIAYRPHLLTGSDRLRGGGVATDIGYGGEDEGYDPD
jgi:hypothetical protein